MIGGNKCMSLHFHKVLVLKQAWCLIVNKWKILIMEIYRYNFVYNFRNTDTVLLVPSRTWISKCGLITYTCIIRTKWQLLISVVNSAPANQQSSLTILWLLTKLYIHSNWDQKCFSICPQFFNKPITHVTNFFKSTLCIV